MDDLDVLARDFGYRPQGKNAPMRSSEPSTVRSSTSSPFMDDRDGLLFNDVFGGPPKYTSTTNAKSSGLNDFDYDSIFKSSSTNTNNVSSDRTSTKTPSDGPVYDKPVYDDDIFEGLPGLKSKSVSSASPMKFEDDMFVSMASPPKQKKSEVDQFDDLLGNLGRNEREAKNARSSSLRGVEDLLGNFGKNEKSAAEPKSSGRSSSSRGFDDLLGGFGSGSPTSGNRTTTESNHPPKKTNPMDDPFVVLESTSPEPSSSGVFTDPLEEMSQLGKSGSSKVANSSVSGGVFDDLDPLNGFGKPVPPFSPEKGGREKDGSPSWSEPNVSKAQTPTGREHSESSSFRYSESQHQKKVPVDNFQESPLFDMPSISTDSKKSFSQNASSPPPYSSAAFNEKNFQADVSPRSEEQPKSSDDIWLSVSEIPLFTQPTKALPPSRPPPPIPRRTSKAESGFFSPGTRKKNDEFSASYSSYSDSPRPGRPDGKSPSASQIDELEDFAMGRTQISSDDNANVQSSEDMDAAAAAMKEAMDRAEAKFRHAKEVREREYAKAARTKENFQMEKDEQVMQDVRDREYKENQERLERERRQREKEEEEALRKLERERIERERARQAVERATREARERAAIDARERAAAEARLRAERFAVEKAQAEARGRAEKVAVQRAQAEARERAAAEAKDRAERAAAEARERSSSEARERETKEKVEARRRSERAAVERAAAEARERAAAAARASQQKNENDLESFFSTRPSSAPKARASSSDPFFDQFQNKGGSDTAKRTSSTSGPPSNIKKASSTTNIVDDLSSIFGAPSSSGEFQEVEGETEERRRARLERHQRTQERAAKALAEKNQRDMQAQRDQEERHRIAETLDIEIKRWAAGKEGNLRALLSTLQYVLWPECGWQPVSLTDLITGAHVKKVYRKATLCIHPDKVQQKGATLQQKYIAEKVFDLLKEAWNKFNSEELF